MDPVSHVLLGRALAVVNRGERVTRGVTAACVAGALAPDLDLVMAARGWDVYLRVHESWTHTLAASPLVAVAVAATVRLATRADSLAALWRAAWLGVVVGHLAFDLVSGSDIRMLQPLSSVRLGPHLLAMGDPLAVVVVVSGTIAMAMRRRLRVGARTAAVGTIVALAGVCGLKCWSQRAAIAIVERSLSSDPASSFVSRPYAVNGSLSTWWFYERAGTEVRAWRVNARTGDIDLSFFRRSADSDPEVTASSTAPVVRTLLGLAAVPFARIEHDDRGAAVLWSDLRYCDAETCTLSFGLRFDRAGHPRSQIVRVGWYEKDRGPW